MCDRIYVTTTIPYVNAPPHVGHALELVQADALARWHRLLGTRTRLQTGTDENAFKNVLSARAQGLSPRELVDRNAARFRELARGLRVSADCFLRTATPEHARAVQALLARLRPGDLYRDAYRGLYCPGCEDFFQEKDLTSDGACPDHGNVVAQLEEANVFFRLSAYEDALADAVRSGRLRILSEARRTEVLRFIEGGLQDISITRDAARSGGWGVPFPEDPSLVVYVWIDALVNYLTGLGFPDQGPLRAFWSAGSRRIHLIGKNVWKFHAVYWPALLLSAGIPLPDEIVVHGFLTQNGRKISKSSGGSRDPLDYVTTFGADAVRYFFLRHVRPFQDSDFSEARLAEAYEGELANGLGNLCSRLTALCERARVGGGSPHAESPPAVLAEHLAEYRFDRALDLLWEEVGRINREIAGARPWERAPECPDGRAELTAWVGQLRRLAHWLSPFLPDTANRLERTLAAPEIRRTAPLFPRLPDALRS
jgi:methionyl-tRNA synthetase